jgi:hypothetical protein
MRREAKVVVVTQTASSTGSDSKVTLDIGMASRCAALPTMSKSSIRLADGWLRVSADCQL